MLSRGLPVGWELVPGLQVDPAEGGVRVQGSLMESARVFAGADVSFSGGRVLVTLRSRLLDPADPGSPDFDVIVPVLLPPGRHPVIYAGRDEERPIGQIELEA